MWADFGGWGTCSKTCGTGTRTRTRGVLTQAENGGAGCDGDSAETQNCNTQLCPGTS